MKIFILLFCLIAVNVMGYAQGEASDFTGNTSDRPRDPRADQMNFVPNEVLVKFKDDVVVPGGTTLKSAGISSVDKLLRANGVASLEKLFPTEIKLKSARIMKDPTGRDMKIPSLHNIYRITVPQLKSTNSTPADIFKFMEEMKALPEVEYAEPNYIFTIGDFTPAGREMTMLEAIKQTANSELSTTAKGLVPNDPLYNSQWGIPATNIDDVWNTTTGDSTAIIAILDTGVDWKHPDLAANIWKNKQEIPDNGRDDDDNGLVDDIRGWDYINNDNNPMDDNSHGTHVAGIAAAVGNNGIGIAGANWRAKIIPIKVFQSSGKGDAATIAKGITYAASKGASVINMSFGSYTESLTMKNALANAYATAVLVAAAGNDALCIGPGKCLDGRLGTPMYPGAFSFVLGVEANKQILDLYGIRAGFSNFDQDGPVFSQYSDLLNYELKAPGSGILSCVPNGNYREYNGTSMAAPLVAGAVSLYRKQKPDESQELLFGNLINSLGQHIDLEAALNIIPEPRLDIVSYTVTDTIDGDKDGLPDAGETIELKVKVRNSWGQANDVKVGIEFGEFEDLSTATILTSEARIGSVSAYATKENTLPLKLKLALNINDGRTLILNLKTWYGDHKGEIVRSKIFEVENGVELSGIISKNLTLDSTHNYIVTENVVVSETATITIQPGTHISFYEGKKISGFGKINAIGEPNKPIVIEGNGSPFYNGIGINGIFKYCQFKYINGSLKQYYENCTFDNCQGLVSDYISPQFIRCNFTNCYSVCYYSGFSLQAQNCIISNNSGLPFYMYGGPQLDFFENSIYSNGEFDLMMGKGFFECHILQNYWGTIDIIKLDPRIMDYFEFSHLGVAILDTILLKPSRDTHGHVWKILVNGKDAQDEFEQLDPLGVGKQKMEVYFNRAMDIKYTPSVSMGVRYPYLQTAIAEDGRWNADSTIYTIYGIIGLSTADGINTIRVDGAKDMDHFEIPIEDRRFRVIVNVAGSLSEGFEATSGMGKIVLKWEKPDASVSDLMGYNIYRYTYKSDLTTTDTAMINSMVVAGTEYTDFAVQPDTKYFYAYKTVRTNLTESNISKVVAATPLTASKGDANGDLNVNVLDVSTIVSYLLSNNPKPFILEAADMNSDKSINVLDIVDLANVIYSPTITDPTATNKLINLYVIDDILYMDAPRTVAAFQFDFSGIISIDEIQKLPALDGFETSYGKVGDAFRFLAYSLSIKSIPEGTRIPLLKLKKGSGLNTSVFSDQAGHQINSYIYPTGIWNLRDDLDGKTAELSQNYPNPLSTSTTIPLNFFEPVDEAIIRIVNAQGQEMEVICLKSPELGEHLITWNAGANKGLIAYMLEIKRGNKQFLLDVKKMIVH